MLSLRKTLAAFALFGALLGHDATGQAGTIVGGSALLTSADVIQLETWLGEGPITLTNIYTKTSGDTSSSNFHPAVDGQGRTFAIIEVTGGDNYIPDPNNGPGTVYTGPYALGRQVIGGYNPQSWFSASSGFWNFTPNVNDMTSFIFNLTQGIYKEQVNQYQANNYEFFGPTFGTGYDIAVFDSLNRGRAESFSYCDAGTAKGADATVYGCSFAFSQTPQNNILGHSVSTSDLTIGGIEVFTIALASTGPEPTPTNQDPGQTTRVPEPDTALLSCFALLCLGFARRRLAVGR